MYVGCQKIPKAPNQLFQPNSAISRSYAKSIIVFCLFVLWWQLTNDNNDHFCPQIAKIYTFSTQNWPICLNALLFYISHAFFTLRVNDFYHISQFLPHEQERPFNTLELNSELQIKFLSLTESDTIWHFYR